MDRSDDGKTGIDISDGRIRLLRIASQIGGAGSRNSGGDVSEKAGYRYRIRREYGNNVPPEQPAPAQEAASEVVATETVAQEAATEGGATEPAAQEPAEAPLPGLAEQLIQTATQAGWSMHKDEAGNIILLPPADTSAPR